MNLILENRSKYRQILDHLRKEIKKGKYPDDDPFYSNNTLAAEFGVSNLTAGKVLSMLAQEDLIYRINGKGSFIKPRTSKQTFNSFSAILQVSTGHFFGILAKSLINEIQQAGALLSISDLVHDNKANEIIFTQVMNSNAKGLLIDGVCNVPFDFLKGNEKKLNNPVFIYRYEYDYIFPNASYVLTDQRYGVAITVQHLQKLGHERIALLSHEFRPETYLQPQFYEFSEHFEALDSFKNTIKEANSSAIPEIIYQPQEENACRKQIKELLSRKNRPTAFLAMGDHRLVKVLEVAKELSIKVPEELSLVGYYDTPWTTVLTPQITSVSLKQEEIAKVAIKQLTSDTSPNKPNKIIIKPELIIRESTARKA